MTWMDNNTGLFVLSASLFIFICFFGFVYFIREAIRTKGKIISGFTISEETENNKKLETRIKAIEDLLKDAKKNGKCEG